MNAAARRSAHRRGWPRGLYEPRPGYYVWRHPSTGETLPIGRVSLAQAKNEASAANLHVAGIAPTLLERVASNGKTVADLLGKMPAAEKSNTRNTQRTHDKRIAAALGHLACSELTTMRCAEFLEGIEAEGKARSAEAVRSRLIGVCRRGQQLGWLSSNPAEPTRKAAVTVKRGRLTLDAYRAIRAKADETAPWLGQAMDVALCLGVDVSTLSKLKRKDIDGEWIEFQRGKTAVRIRVPLGLTMTATGLVLREVLRSVSGVASPWIIHHRQNYGNAPRGSSVAAQKISKAFTDARRAAGIPEKAAPTFHEIRSLCKRTYEAQGGIDTKALLGHLTEKMAALYGNARGAEALVVKVDPAPPSEREVNSK